MRRFTVRENIRDWLLDESMPPVSGQPRSTKHSLTDEDYTSFDDAVDSREDKVWQQLDSLLLQLRVEHPIRTDRIRQDLKWLQKKAQRKRF